MLIGGDSMWYDFIKKMKGIGTMELLTYQTAVFFKNKHDRPDELWYGFSKKFEGIIDRMPVIMPLPEDAPEELPVVSFTSANGIFTINVSRMRADLIINLEGKAPLEEAYIRGICKDFAQEMSILTSVKRTGIVGRFVVLEEHNVERINEKYFSNRFNDAVELSLRVNNRTAYEGLSLNDILDIQSTEGEKDGKRVHGIYVLRDINNVDRNTVISGDKIGKLVNFAFDCFDEVRIKELL